MCKLNHPVFSTNINCCREKLSNLWAIGWEPSRTVCPPTQLAKSFDGNAVDVLEDHVDDVEDDHLGLHHLRIHLEHVHQHLLAEAHQHRGRLQYHGNREHLHISNEKQDNLNWENLPLCGGGQREDSPRDTASDRLSIAEQESYKRTAVDATCPKAALQVLAPQSSSRQSFAAGGRSTWRWRRPWRRRR